ncbi:MAG: CPBP family intramembrane metalloprotease [Proteobacteria bacterium]|nr:CPBP family intramembrane metalloprotease [Pseudomonadota bacterium]
MDRQFDPPEAQPPSVLPSWNPLTALLFMLMCMFAWRVTVECTLGLLTAVGALLSGVSAAQLAESPESILRADAVAVGTAVQLIGMVLVIAFCLRMVGWNLGEGFAARKSKASLLGIAGVSGLAVGFFPGWISEQLLKLIPEDFDMAMNEQIIEWLTSGPPLGRALMLIAVVIIAPIFEELAFRGGLWAVTERAAHLMLGDKPERLQAARMAAFVATSFAFAAYHLDPIHVLSLLPTAFLLGWLRLVSNSVYPGIVAHFANNGLAAVLSHLPQDPSESTPLWAALLSLLLTLMFCAIAWMLRERETA